MSASVGTRRPHTFDVQILSTDGRRATCSCGWNGYDRPTLEQASADFDDHRAGRPARPKEEDAHVH